MAKLGRDLLIVLLATLLGGCAARNRETPAPVSDARAALRDLVSNDDGLEVRQWAISADLDHVAATLAAFADGEATDAARLEALRRNGLALVRVPRGDLARLREALGVATLNLTAWHGQVYEWRELLRRRVGPGPTALAIDGRVRRYEPGAIRLMARAWTVPMETGPYLGLELLPVYETPRAASLDRLLGTRGLSGEALHSLALELALAPGHAWILTGSIRDAERSDADEAPEAGPAATMPATVGELLFSGPTDQPTTGLLIFVPQIKAPALEPAGS